MPRARTKRGHIRQVENWLRANFDTQWPVVVTVKEYSYGGRHVDLASTQRDGTKINIVLSKSRSRSEVIDDLLHEWAHATTWRLDKMELIREMHDDEWALAYGRIYRAYHDDGGRLEVYKEDTGSWK